VDIHNNGAWCAQYWHSAEEFGLCARNMSIILSRDNLVNGARRVLVHGGGVLKSGMVQRVE
jgi:hypothetical protein